jgi:SAM-dependent methyltransferase
MALDRRSKLAKFAEHLTCPVTSDTFPVFAGDQHFDLSQYESESTNLEFGPFATEIMANPEKLYLDLGCGRRDRTHDNCLYLEVYPSSTADLIVPATCDYPIKDETFDGIGCFAVMEHTRKPWMVAREIYRMLKPGGKIWIDWPFLQPVHGYPSHYFNATREGLRSIFVDVGFEVFEIGTWAHQKPDFSIAWPLGIFVQALPPETREKFMGLTVRELLAHAPRGELWNEFIDKLDDTTVMTLACGNCLVATK